MKYGWNESSAHFVLFRSGPHFNAYFVRRLISESQKHSKEHGKLETELRSMQRIKQSQRFATLGEDEQSLIINQISALEKQCEDKTLKLSGTITKLMETNYWPVLHPPDMQGAEAKYLEIKKIVTDLKDVVTKVNSDLRLLVADRNLSKSTGEQTMDVDQRPSKRRRVDDDDEIGVFPGGGQGYRAEELNLVRDSLENLENQRSDISNELIQRDSNIMDDIVSAIDGRWEDAGPPPAHTSENGTVAEDLVQRIEDNLGGTGADVSALAEEIGNLMSREPDIAAEIQQLKEENARIRENCTAVSIYLIHCIFAWLKRLCHSTK